MSTDELRDFAEAHRLRTTPDEVAGAIVQGRRGYLFANPGGGLRLITEADGPSTPGQRAHWLAVVGRCKAAGMRVLWTGDTEGRVAFDADNPAHAVEAIRAVGAHQRRWMSAEQRAACAARLAAYRVRAADSAENAKPAGTGGAPPCPDTSGDACPPRTLGSEGESGPPTQAAAT